MSDISAIGLGDMGAALARQLLNNQHDVTVWNRTPAKMEPLVAAGATGAASLADAVTASPVVLVCIDDYTATLELLGADDITPHLEGRTVVQLSTGTPKEALAAEAWMRQRGAYYLDGAIIGGPENLDRPSAEILFAGPEATYVQARPLLSSLCTNVRHVGENVRAAATLDLAWLCQQYGNIIGVVQGAYLCETEDVSVDLLAGTYRKSDASWCPVLASVIHEETFADTDATLRVWNNVAQMIRRQASDAGVRNDFMDFMANLMERGIAAGYGEEDAAALIKIIRSGS